jgi:hypothetical protein
MGGVKLRNKANFSVKNPMKGHQCPKKQTHFKPNQTQFKANQTHRRGPSGRAPSNRIKVNQTKSDQIKVNPTFGKTSFCRAMARTSG